MNTLHQALIDAVLRLGWTSRQARRGQFILKSPEGVTIATADPKNANETDTRELRSALRRAGIGTVEQSEMNVPLSIQAFLPAPAPEAIIAAAGPTAHDLAHGIEAVVEMVDIVADEVGEIRLLVNGLTESRDALTRATSEIRAIAYNVRDDLRKLAAGVEEHRAGHLTTDDLSKSHAHCVTPADLKRVADTLDLAITDQLAAVNPLAALRAKMRGEAS